jgi:single-strand DNA-binding protein
MASVNKVILIGHLGADPETKSFQNGGKIANFRIATSEAWKDKQSGERKERTEWHSISVQNEGLAGVVERYLRKGSKVYVEGQLRTRKWQDKDGSDRYTTEVVLGGISGVLVMLDSAGGGQNEGGGQSGARGNARGGGNQRQQGGDGSRGHAGGFGGGNSGGSGGGFADDLDDDVPFISCGGVW